MRIFLFLFFSLTILTLQAQLVNQGGTITVKSGATLVVESNLTNTTGSIVLESGATLEITGNFTNQATMNFNAASEVIFTGSSNSQVTSGGGTFGNVRVDKTSAKVVLADDMIMNGQLNFTGTNAKVELGSNDLTLGSSGSVAGAGGSNYVVATGSGRFIKPISANSTLTFEVGDNDASTNYSPLSAAVTGSGYSSATVGVNLVNAVHPNKPATSSDYLTRYWNVLAGGITGYSANLTGTYIAGNDVVGTQSLIDGASYNGADWDYTNAAHSGSTVSSTATNTDIGFTGFKKGDVTLDAKVYLSNVSVGTGLMTTTLKDLVGEFPMTDPYASAPFSTSGHFTYEPAQAASTTTQTVLDNNNVVDWVFVELRTGVSGSTTVVASKSGLLKNDGGIINPDGTAFSFSGVAAGNYKVAIKHRNHCGFMTDVEIALPNAALLNLTNGSVTLYGTDPLRNMGSSVYSMWTGDVNVNKLVNTQDVTLIRAVSGTISNAYHIRDVNLNGLVNTQDVTLVRPNSGLRSYQID